MLGGEGSRGLRCRRCGHQCGMESWEGRGGEVSWKRVNRIGGDPFQFVWEDCRFERNVEDLREEEKERESC